MKALKIRMNDKHIFLEIEDKIVEFLNKKCADYEIRTDYCLVRPYEFWIKRKNETYFTRVNGINGSSIKELFNEVFEEFERGYE